MTGGSVLKIAVLMGGVSGEREVSLGSGVQVARALKEAGHDALSVDTSRGVLSQAEEASILESGLGFPGPGREQLDMLVTGDLSLFSREPRLEGIDLVFPALHGGRGEDGTLQALLEITGIPYVGSDMVGCALSMDKDLAKRLLRAAGVPTPDWITVVGEMEGNEALPEVIQRLGLPVIVKPPSGGSTLGLTLAHDETELVEGLHLSLTFEERVMFESYVQGRELTVPVVGAEALVVGEIIPEHELFDYECKYQPGMAQEIFPADISPGLAASLRVQALLTHETLRLRDLSRVDFIVDGSGRHWCLEANSLPGMTSNSLVPKSARASGISFPELCDRLARMALDRER